MLWKNISFSSIINAQTIDEDVRMDILEKLLATVHTTPISQGKDGRWRTRIVINGKTKQIAKTKRDDLIKYLIDFYDVKSCGMTFDAMYHEYRNYKAQITSDNTMYKYDADYNRFFKDQEFVSKGIGTIAEEDVEVFIIRRIRELGLLKKAYESMWGYLKGTFKLAKNRRIIDMNPMDALERKAFYRYCIKPNADPSKRIISDAELKLIFDRVQEDHRNNPKFITVYAVELANLTGMRVGELAALRWDRIDYEKGVIKVDLAEVFHQKTKTYTIENTKNGEIRYIPMTDEIKSLLDKIRETEERFDYICEWVFANDKGRIHKIAIGSCAKNKSKQVGLSSKSIHAYRRTINSRMKANGVSSEVAAAILGHTVEVNDKNYTYDVTSMDYKKKALTEAQVTL